MGIGRRSATHMNIRGIFMLAIRPPVLGILLWLSGYSNAQSAVIFDNFDSNGGFHPENYMLAAQALSDTPNQSLTSYFRLAVQFAIPNNNFYLESITFPIAFQGNAPGNTLRVRLTEDNGGTPGTTLEVLRFSGNSRCRKKPKVNK
jgi:hypothetical protein